MLHENNKKVIPRKRLPEAVQQLKEYRKKAAIYEKRYNKSCSEFSVNLPDDMKSHDDWIECSYLAKVAGERGNEVKGGRNDNQAK